MIFMLLIVIYFEFLTSVLPWTLVKNRQKKTMQQFPCDCQRL